MLSSQYCTTAKTKAFTIAYTIKRAMKTAPMIAKNATKKGNAWLVIRKICLEL